MAARLGSATNSTQGLGRSARVTGDESRWQCPVCGFTQPLHFNYCRNTECWYRREFDEMSDSSSSDGVAVPSNYFGGAGGFRCDLLEGEPAVVRQQAAPPTAVDDDARSDAGTCFSVDASTLGMSDAFTYIGDTDMLELLEPGEAEEDVGFTHEAESRSVDVRVTGLEDAFPRGLHGSPTERWLFDLFRRQAPLCVSLAGAGCARVTFLNHRLAAAASRSIRRGPYRRFIVAPPAGVRRGRVDFDVDASWFSRNSVCVNNFPANIRADTFAAYLSGTLPSARLPPDPVTGQAVKLEVERVQVIPNIDDEGHWKASSTLRQRDLGHRIRPTCTAYLQFPSVQQAAACRNVLHGLTLRGCVLEAVRFGLPPRPPPLGRLLPESFGINAQTFERDGWRAFPKLALPDSTLTSRTFEPGAFVMITKMAGREGSQLGVVVEGTGSGKFVVAAAVSDTPIVVAEHDLLLVAPPEPAPACLPSSGDMREIFGGVSVGPPLTVCGEVDNKLSGGWEFVVCDVGPPSVVRQAPCAAAVVRRCALAAARGAQSIAAASTATRADVTILVSRGSAVCTTSASVELCSAPVARERAEQGAAVLCCCADVQSLSAHRELLDLLREAAGQSRFSTALVSGGVVPTGVLDLRGDGLVSMVRWMVVVASEGARVTLADGSAAVLVRRGTPLDEVCRQFGKPFSRVELGGRLAQPGMQVNTDLSVRLAQ